MKKWWQDIFAGLWAAPVRTALVFISLVVGWLAMGILLFSLSALQQQADRLVGDFGADAFMAVQGGDEQASPRWTRGMVESISAALEGQAVVAGIKWQTLQEEPQLPPMTVALVDGRWAQATGRPVAVGRPLDTVDVWQRSRHAVLTEQTARAHNVQPGQTLLLGREPFDVAGVVAGGAGFPVAVDAWIPWTADVLEREAGENRFRVDALHVRALPSHAPEQVRRRLAALLEQRQAGTVEWITPDTLLAGIRQWQQAILWTAGTGALLALLLGAVTLSGLLITGVRERIAEIGLRRALGAGRLEVAGLFVGEALLLTLPAAAAGTALAAAVLWANRGAWPFPVHFDMAAAAVPLLMAGVLALGCSIGPAWSAARLPPAEALRNE